MTVLIVAAAVLAVVVVLGLIGDGSMDFYAVAEREAAHQRDKAARPRTHRQGLAERHSRPRKHASAAASP